VSGCIRLHNIHPPSSPDNPWRLAVVNKRKIDGAEGDAAEDLPAGDADEQTRTPWMALTEKEDGVIY